MLPALPGAAEALRQTRTRYTEDIPENIEPVVTEHVIHRDWCPRCKKSVEPRVPDALPGSQIGNRVVALSGWLHYGLGQTLDHIVEVFNCHLHFKLTPGRPGAAVVSAARDPLSLVRADSSARRSMRPC